MDHQLKPSTISSGKDAEIHKTVIYDWFVCHKNFRTINGPSRKVQKKGTKKLTSVSFAFTHTYTPVKANIFPFFPKRTWKILKNVQKRKN